MNDRENRRYDMFGRVQTFGKDNTADFAAGSKAAGHFTTLAQVITDLNTAKAGQDGGTATAKSVLLDALRLDLQNIARTARAIDAAEPGFADRYRLPDSPSQTALLTTADAVVLALAQPGIPAKFIAYEMPADFVQDLKDDLAAIRGADDDMESDDQDGVSSTAAVGRLIKAGMAERSPSSTPSCATNTPATPTNSAPGTAPATSSAPRSGRRKRTTAAPHRPRRHSKARSSPAQRRDAPRSGAHADE